jgi:hypothetical protein
MGGVLVRFIYTLQERSFEDGPGFEKRLDPVSAIFTADAGVFEECAMNIVRYGGTFGFAAEIILPIAMTFTAKA